MSFYRNLLKFVQIFVICVVLPRVASFVGLIGNNKPGFDLHDIIRYAFAAALGLGTVATAYFSNEVDPPVYDDEPPNPRERKRREREAVYFATMNNAAPSAGIALFAFAFLDGTFNLADAFNGASSGGLLDMATQGTFLVYLYGAATFVFGVSPTILSIVLSKVISAVDRIPKGIEKPVSRQQLDLMRTVMGNLGLREYSAGDAANLMSSGSTEPNELEPNGHRPNSRPNLPYRGNHQNERITEYLNSQHWDHVPTIPEIQNAVGEPVPAKSTVSVVRSAWLEEVNASPSV